MSTDSAQIVAKAWNFAHALRDVGLSYLAYTEQIMVLLPSHPQEIQQSATVSEPGTVREPVGERGRRCRN